MRVAYVGAAGRRQLRRELDAVEGIDQMVADGAAEITSTGERHGDQPLLDAATRAEAYAEASWDAIADGYTGLRVAADATEIVLDDPSLDAFVRYEAFVDRRMATGLPFSAMCAYDRNRLSDEAIDELACVHPAVHGSGCSFRISASATGGLRLSGEVDGFSAPLLAKALRRLPSPWSDDDAVRIDCHELRFIDHRGLLALHAAGADTDGPVELIGTAPVVERLVDLLDLHRLRPRRHDPR